MFKTIYAFKCRSFLKHKFLNGYKYACYCTSKREDSQYEPPKPENPFKRAIRVVGNDIMREKHKIESFFSMIQNAHNATKKLANSQYRDGVFPEHCDFVIIGGGGMGSSIAYWLKQRAPNAITVTVIEKDPLYVEASTTHSVGGLIQQFSVEENIKMSLFAADFLRNIKQHLSVEGHDPPDVQFTPFGYLYLASERDAEQLQVNANLQKKLGAKSELLSPTKLKQKFPWINTEGIALGCHGLENEGWFDPLSLLYAFKRKALSLGVEYINGEAVGFEFKSMPDMLVSGIEPGSFENVDKVLVKLEDGELRSIKFAIVIIAAGSCSGKVARMARIGTGEGLLSVPLPVEQRKQYTYCISSKTGPGLNTPLTIDPSGTYFRMDGLAGDYICGRSWLTTNEPNVETLDGGNEFFDNNIRPVLTSRILNFESMKVNNVRSSYFDYNTYDGHGFIGPHPYYTNVYIATGLCGHGIQQSPAIGRCIMEMLLDGGYQTIDLSRMNFDRLITDTPIIEQNVF